MASLLSYVQLLAFFFIMAASQRISTISPNSVLTPTTNPPYWLSPSGLYAFGFYPRGSDGSGGFSIGIFIASIPQKTVVWTANRNSLPLPTNATMELTADGRLTLQSVPNYQNFDIVITISPISSASMLDSGNFVLYDSSRNIIWQSFDFPTDTLLQGQSLLANRNMTSSISSSDQSMGLFYIIMQGDSNLVMYPAGITATIPNAYWASGIFQHDDVNVTLSLSNDGLLYLRNTTGSYIKNITKGGFPTGDNVIYMAKVDTDGMFRLYSYNYIKGNWSVIWVQSNNLCDPKGACGFNAFCVEVDQGSSSSGDYCQCLPGYMHVDPRNWVLGCQKNYSTPTCDEGGSGGGSIYFQTVNNTVWDSNSIYFNMMVSSIDECRAACSKDCTCEAVMYEEDGNCRKIRLPLTYGRRNTANLRNTLFIRVGEPPIDGSSDNGSVQRGSKVVGIGKDILVASVSLAIFGLLLLMASVYILICKNRTRARYGRVAMNNNGSIRKGNLAPRSFTYDELQMVTNDFQEEIGKGAFGTVYKGTMSDGQIVAVKRLDRLTLDNNGDAEFRMEMKIIGRTHHRNLIQLLGYSFDGSNRILVYEYMINGSLADLLYKKSEKKTTWSEKVSIARGIARGLVYLHEECETQIIHCDIKPHNVLIDEHGSAKISDFGISKMLMSDQTNTFTKIRGTRGYVAPEWYRNQPITAKVDVYSFGIVLLETVCCRRSLDWKLPHEEAVLEDWVYDCFHNGELYKLVDTNEDHEVDIVQLEMMVKVAMWCTLDEPSSRPTMKHVALMLEGAQDVPMPT